MGELYPRCCTWRCARKARHRAQHRRRGGDRLELSLDLLERLCAEPGAGKGWNGIGFVIQAYQKRCPAVVDYLIDLARRSGHRLMVRLVKGAYWDSEIKRAQLDGQAGYPVYTRKAYTDVAYLACARKLLAAPDAVYPQFATHNAQTLAASTRSPGPTTTPGSTSSSACTAWASRCTSRSWARWPRASWAAPAASTRRWARTTRCWPTWCAGCWRTAPTPPSSTASPTSVPLEELVEDPVAHGRAMAASEGALGLPHPAIPLPRALYGARRGQLRGLDLADEPRCASLARVCRRREAPGFGAPLLAPTRDAGRRPSRAQPGRSRDRRPGERGQRRRGRRAGRRQPAAPAWAALAAAARAAVLEARADCAGSRHRTPDGRCWCARPARPPPTPWPRCARRWTSCATTPPRCGATSTTPATAAGAGGLHQPLELPAGHLHRPGRRGAGRRQRGAGQAGRADAAGRRRGGARCCTRPACRAARCNCCPAAARPWARRWWPMRGCRA
jgi:RHH-type proline utilization regulon transcriptional repressor/proline dehydrogenase/delta 1-pyrroline-5-carboxylate dehydrogenase